MPYRRYLPLTIMATSPSSTSSNSGPPKARPPRVGIIGGGVVGLAIARRLAMAGLPSIVFEQGPDALGGCVPGVTSV
jgi:NADPH-dependent 2,4-dienoyl-CoA reductase/sulfur reductase-like enzyme